MSQLNFHKKSLQVSPPPAGLPVIQKLVVAYKQWHQFLLHFPKTSRYTLGSKIDSLFLETIESALAASNLSKREKLSFVHTAITKLDALKFFLQVAWEVKSLDNKKYIALSEYLNEVGKMLGGWLKQLAKENPPS